MPKNVFHFVIALSLVFALFGKAQAYRYRRARDFLPGTVTTATGAPTEATFLTIGSELMAPETGEGGFTPLFIFAAIPGGEVDSTYHDTIDLIVYESIANNSAKVYPGHIPDTTASQMSIELAEGTAIVWVQDSEEEELIFVAAPRDTLKPSIPCMVTITPSGDSATRLLIEGNGEINAGIEIPCRYLIKAVDDSLSIVPSYSGFADPARRTIITVSESNPNGSAYLADFLWGSTGQSISTYLTSGMANVFLFDTEPETLTLVATTVLGELQPDTFWVEVLPSEETINLLLLSWSGSFGTVSAEKNLLAIAFNVYAEAPDPSNNSSEIELKVHDIIGTESASVYPSSKTMTSGIAQFKLSDTEPDSGVIIQALARGTPQLYPLFVDKTVYGFKPRGKATIAKMSAPTTCVVGDTAVLIMFAVDGFDSIDFSYDGWLRLDIDEGVPNGSASLLEYPTGNAQEMVRINNGVGTIWLVDEEAEEINVTFEDAEGSFPLGTYLGSQTPGGMVVIHFEPPGGSAAHWTVELPPRATVGIVQTGTVKAVDDSGYVDTTFTDTARLSSTGHAILSDSLVPVTRGVATFAVVNDSVEEIIVHARNGGLTPGEDTIAFTPRGAAAYLVPATASQFLVRSELQVALLAVSPEFELDETWTGVARLTVTDPGAASVTALSGDIDSIPIANGAGRITITDSEVELLELRAQWVSGYPPLQSYPSEKVESEVQLIVSLPESAFVGGFLDTISLETRDGNDSLFPYITWFEIGWEESNPNGSVSFSGPTDSIPLIGGTGFIGIEDSEQETVSIWVSTDDRLVAERETFSGNIHFSSIGVEESKVDRREVHYLSNCLPNPFMKSTSIAYAIGGKKVVFVRLRIYDAAGKLVKTLVSGPASPGFYRVFWDGKDNRNKSAASGIYFYRLELPQKVLIRKAILLR